MSDALPSHPLYAAVLAQRSVVQPDWSESIEDEAINALRAAATADRSLNRDCINQSITALEAAKKARHCPMATNIRQAAMNII